MSASGLTARDLTFGDVFDSLALARFGDEIEVSIVHGTERLAHRMPLAEAAKLWTNLGALVNGA